MEQSEKLLEKIAKQNELIISLLGRMVFKRDELRKLVIQDSKRPTAILRAYNLCDGSLTVTEIASKVGLTQSAISQAIGRWEKLGIIFKTTEKGAVYPIKLYPI